MAVPEKIDFIKSGDKKEFDFCAAYIAENWGIPSERAAVMLSNFSNREWGTFCLVAKINKETVGMVASFPNDPEVHPTFGPWIGSLYVVEKFRKQGLGVRLLSRAIDQARNQDVRRLYLNAETKQLRTWYEKMGWKSVEKAQWKGHDLTIMTLDL